MKQWGINMNEKYTIEIFKGIKADISCYFQPYEKPEGGFPLSNPYPGCEEEFYIEEVKVNGEDITESLADDFLLTLLQRIIDDAPEPDHEEISKRRRSLWHE